MPLPTSTLLYYPLHDHVRAFSTTRLSPFGLSAEELQQMGCYAAFNVTHYCGDDPQRVQRNREWLAAQLDILPGRIWLPRQTHTDRIACIDDDFLKMAPDKQQEKLDEVDALITQIPQQCIGVSTADCIPVLLYDSQHHAAAAIHAGWRGTRQRIVSKTVEAMHLRFGTLASELRAVIGPGISAAAYEVGEEVVRQFLDAGFPQTVVWRRGPANDSPYSKPHLDLQAANCYLLEEAGLDLSHIQVVPVCTYRQCDSFFSARRLGIQSGRIYTAVIISPTEHAAENV